MPEQKLRVGIIGMGLYAAMEHVPSLRATGRAEVVAAARRDPNRLALAQRELGILEGYTDWRELLAQADLDAVVVSTPHNLHLEPTLAALDRGLHVLVEKPLAASTAEARAILQATKRSNRVVSVGVNRRGDPSWKTAQRTIASGQVGRLRQIHAVLTTDLRTMRGEIPIDKTVYNGTQGSEMFTAFLQDFFAPGTWRNDPLQLGGDMFTDIGAHLVDVMLWMGGAPPVELIAYAPRDCPPRAAVLSVQALLANEVILSITFNDNIAMGNAFTWQGASHLTAYGDGGTLAITANIGSGPADSIMLEKNGVRQEVTVEGEKISPAEAFVASILDGAPVQATVEDAARVVEFIQAAYRSSAERRIVQIGDSV